MNFFSELKSLGKVLLVSGIAWLGLATLLFSTPLVEGKTLVIVLFNNIQHNLLPPGVRLIVTNPLSAFLTQIEIGLLLGFVAALPLLLYKIIIFLSPALFPKEKKALIWSLIPSLLLFLAGCVFAYTLLIPLTFRILSPYATSLQAEQLYYLDEFIGLVLSFVVATGVMFLLPIFMFMVSAAGIVKGSFWRGKWRWAFLIFLVFSAVITPDGTGITMMLLFVPLIILYGLGCLLTRRFVRGAI